VIIAVHGAPRELLDQLRSLHGQSVPGPWSVLLADNGGGDLSAILAGLSADPTWLRIVDATDVAGQAAAINRAVAATTADALVLLDADDEVADGYVSAMWRALDDHPFVGGRLDCDSLNPEWLRRSRPPTQVDAIGASFGFLPSAAGCAIGLRRWAFDLVGGFDETIPMGVDIDLSWRLQLAGVPVEFAPDAVVRYRYRDDLRGIFRQARAYGDAGVELFSRYRGLGMTRRGWRSAVRFHLAALARAVRVRSKSDLAALAFLLGYRAGLLGGAIRRRVLYL